MILFMEKTNKEIESLKKLQSHIKGLRRATKLDQPKEYRNIRRKLNNNQYKKVTNNTTYCTNCFKEKKGHLEEHCHTDPSNLALLENLLPLKERKRIFKETQSKNWKRRNHQQHH
eukprot:TRINITY_DN1981_c0_g2_i5.p1 TRINITY_DN1981_c0_g2~~TRINITY_DN1981_c0_g2_i5.p1  ORF type:complete len:115 (+),score=30.79 TRINITY_DN1981_c0_g2_i5:596-940(+)